MEIHKKSAIKSSLMKPRRLSVEGGAWKRNIINEKRKPGRDENAGRKGIEVRIEKLNRKSCQHSAGKN